MESTLEKMEKEKRQHEREIESQRDREKNGESVKKRQ